MFGLVGVTNTTLAVVLNRKNCLRCLLPTRVHSIVVGSDAGLCFEQLSSLLGAIAFEVVGTLLLPASQGFNKLVPSVLVVCSYGASFYFLSIVVQKLPLAIVYASWAGLGVFSIALLSAIFCQQTLNWQTVLGLFLIVIGVTVVNIFKVSS